MIEVVDMTSVTWARVLRSEQLERAIERSCAYLSQRPAWHFGTAGREFVALDAGPIGLDGLVIMEYLVEDDWLEDVDDGEAGGTARVAHIVLYRSRAHGGAVSRWPTDRAADTVGWIRAHEHLFSNLPPPALGYVRTRSDESDELVIGIEPAWARLTEIGVRVGDPVRIEWGDRAALGTVESPSTIHATDGDSLPAFSTTVRIRGVNDTTDYAVCFHEQPCSECGAPPSDDMKTLGLPGDDRFDRRVCLPCWERIR